MPIEFFAVSLLVVASPGTGATYTIATGLSQGARAAAVAAFGCTLGIVPHMLAAVTGLATVLSASSLAFEGLKIAGVIYLLYLAWMTWQDRGTLRLTLSHPQTRPAQIVRQAVLVNLLNPKLSMFFLAFLPQFIAPDEAAPTLTMLGFSAIFMAETFVVFAIYGAFAARMRDQVLASPTVMAWLRRSFAAGFVGLGVKLALTER